jgi:superfamily I DNA and/or RNA helicase
MSTYVCPKCGKRYSSRKFSDNHFCLNCGTMLIRDLPQESREESSVLSRAKSNNSDTLAEREQTNQKPEPQKSPSPSVLDKLKRILQDEKNTALSSRFDESKLTKAEVTNISDEAIVLDCKSGRGCSFREEDEISIIKNKEIVGSSAVLDVVEDLLSVTMPQSGALHVGEEVGLVKNETIVATDLQLDLLKKIESGEIQKEQKPVSFFLGDVALPELSNQVSIQDKKAVNEDTLLDSSQVEAVEKALSLKDGELMLIMGPPGTGKTRVIKKIVCELKGRGEKILITAHTNRAVDNAIEGLPCDYSLRVGKPEKILDQKYLLGYKIKHEIGEWLKAINIELAEHRRIKKRLLTKMEQSPKANDNLGLEGRRISELKAEKNKILKGEQRKLVSEIPIICCTLTWSQLSFMEEAKFDTVIIDECSQASVTLALLAMVKARKWVLVGDYKQLLPIFPGLDEDEDVEELGVFSNLSKRYADRIVWLRTAYRSNRRITEFASKYVYDNNIKPAPGCSKIKLRLGKSLISGAKHASVADPEKPMTFVHVNGQDKRAGTSRYNEEEIDACKDIADTLELMGLRKDDIGIITPYRVQAQRLAEKIKEVEISTVDAFQGREKEVIIFSVTATNNLQRSYSLSSKGSLNRINVALTRPRCKLIVVGNAYSVKNQLDEKNLLRLFLGEAWMAGSMYVWEEGEWIEPSVL